MENRMNRKDRKNRKYLESSICSKTAFFRKENTLIIAYSFYSKSLRTIIETGLRKNVLKVVCSIVFPYRMEPRGV
jgi:hypothetical protein